MSRPPRRRWLRRLLLVAAALFVTSLVPVAALRFIDPPRTAFMLARQWEMRDVPGFSLRHHWMDLDAISPQLPIAVVAAEDQNFPSHHGFDLDAISTAIAERTEGSRTRGASTISQQVAKNLFLWSGRSWLRKGLEAYYTIAIELLWPKRRILEVHVNIAEFGDGIYGAEAAAQHYYGIPAIQLDARQSAALAAVLPNPKRYRIDAPTPYQLQRRVWINRQVNQLGGPAWLHECCGVGEPAR
ncbi:monofunctional biosynthetic peptidoglycan transglycosylase [Xanthomonadaceae bacterium JHOS43]|nr:monofunctional biosynthetic peptidoglycan transglycosylase [Xanthomonadaceae bacterium JHOS43]MCX7562485.1 monofunctional biosynthetic peptidoglycan transglycosylase [Xanthomonadaceae bacterium XH05]